MCLISCKNVSVKYYSDFVVEDVSFSIYPGDYIAIVGKNGSGKSTLLKAILGLKKISCGTINFKVKKNSIGYMPQKIDIKKNFPASVEEIILSGFVSSLFFLSFFKTNHKNKVKSVLNMLGLSSLKDSSFKELSVGQQQKVLLARALGATKTMLFLDEPCASLDPIFTRKFYSLIKELNEREKVAIVMISHDINFALKNAKNILHIDRKPIFFGATSEYIKTGKFKVFLQGESFDELYF